MASQDIEKKSADQHHHGRLREAVIAFAINAATDGAIESLSLRSVSRELGVSSGAVYRHFAGKDELLAEVAAAGFDALAQSFEACMPFASDAVSAAQAQARFMKLADAYVGFSRAHYGLWRLMFGPHGQASAPSPKGRASTYDWLDKSLSELSHFGIIRPHGPSEQFFAWSALHGVADLHAAPVLGEDAQDAAVRGQCRFILGALGRSD